MRRRTLFMEIGTLAGITTLAGCLDRFGGSTETPISGDGGQPIAPSDTSFEVLNRSCGSGDDKASISFTDGDITVEGLIIGRDTCDTAEATVNMESGVLVLTVEIVKEDQTETPVCAQCLTDIDYRFSATFPNEGPSGVKVVHRSAEGESTVATADRS